MRLGSLFVCLSTMLCATSCLSQLSTFKANPDFNTPGPPLVLVYNSTVHGTYLYNASNGGELDLVKGSPFPTVGNAVGSNGSYFITLDKNYLYSYLLTPSGEIGEEVSKIDIAHYTGGECISSARPPVAELDPSRRYVYVSLSNAKVCNALQTYSIGGNPGDLTFRGATLFDDESPYTGGFATLPAILGNDTLAVGVESTPKTACTPYYSEYLRDSDGTINYTGGNWDNPIAQSPDWYFAPTGPITADPNNHLVMAVVQVHAPMFKCGVTGSTQLVSYVASGGGGLVGMHTTNTWANMPTVAAGVRSMKVDPLGRILAVATGNGVEFFHFNGADPITRFTGLITVSGYITQMSWDPQDHLYALSSTGEMHTYTATMTSVKQTSEVAGFGAPGAGVSFIVTGK
jgi:hypothetical protein